MKPLITAAFLALAAACAGMVFLSGCSGAPAVTQVNSPEAPTLTPFQPAPPTDEIRVIRPSTSTASIPPREEPAVEHTPEPGPAAPAIAADAEGLRLWMPPFLPAGLKNAVVLPGDAVLSDQLEASELRLEPGGESPHVRWVYVLAAAFPSFIERASFSDLEQAWRGAAAPVSGGLPLLMDESTYGVFSTLWGEAAAGAVLVMAADDLIEYAWANPTSLALLPFENLEPRWKVLEVDGQSPIRKDFDLGNYPLTMPFTLNSSSLGPEYLAEAAEVLKLPASNRDPNQLTTLAMTGVTAMVRCTAVFMEQRGMAYPASEIGELLASADLTHISNEIPFAENCPYPSCLQDGLVFCSSPRYIELMEAIGTDIVELTGDHFADWGPEAMYTTLEMYRERGWAYYGGGETLEEGRKPLLIEHNGNRLAFLGCNGKSLAGYATASDTNPGAVRCDWEYLPAEITRLRSEGYIPIVTFQHEEYYRFDPAPNLQADFRRVAEAGAQIVSGSQAHQPHGMEFLDQAFIHYGLGNLFFDQFGYCPGDACSQAFINRHVFYGNRYISTELWPIQFVNYALSRLMTAEEKQDFFRVIFGASGW